MRRTILLGDVHLTRQTPAAVTGDLAALVRAHPGARVIVVGDLFDLSAEREPPRSLDEALFAHRTLRQALGEHVGRGGELWLASGNHDAELSREGAAAHVAAALGATAEDAARVRVSPWFFRIGGLHVEHGHLHDPDNAPAHPLVADAPTLGVHFTKEFIAKTGAWAYLNRNDRKPLETFLSSFTLYGARAPYVIYRFFHTAATSLARSGALWPGEAHAADGRAREAAFAEEHDVEPELLRRLAESAPRPTLASTRRTFARLYLDRVAATLALVAGGALLGAGRRRAGTVALAAGALAMATSWALGYDRYRGGVAARLAEGAARTRELTGARAVVFGHTHAARAEDGYANTGSFAFPGGGEGRPYLELEGTEERPRPVPRRFLPSSSR
jgi:hypothetical protein